MEAAAAQGHAPAPAELPQNEFIYYVWVCEIMSQQVSKQVYPRTPKLCRSIAWWQAVAS